MGQQHADAARDAGLRRGEQPGHPKGDDADVVLRFDEPFITLACPRCKTARARPAPIKTPGYGVAFAQAFVTALDGGRAAATPPG